MHYWSWIRCSEGLPFTQFTRRDICATHQLRHRWRFAWNDARHRSIALLQFIHIIKLLAWVLLQISWRMQQWKNFENRTTFVEVMDECRVAQFFDSRCIFCQDISHRDRYRLNWLSTSYDEAGTTWPHQVRHWTEASKICFCSEMLL